MEFEKMHMKLEMKFEDEVASLRCGEEVAVTKL